MTRQTWISFLKTRHTPKIKHSSSFPSGHVRLSFSSLNRDLSKDSVMNRCHFNLLLCHILLSKKTKPALNITPRDSKCKFPLTRRESNLSVVSWNNVKKTLFGGHMAHWIRHMSIDTATKSLQIVKTSKTILQCVWSAKYSTPAKRRKEIFLSMLNLFSYAKIIRFSIHKAMIRKRRREVELAV